MHDVLFKDLGFIEYSTAWEYQQTLLSEMQSAKKENAEINGHLLFCEHPHVYTLGKSGSQDNLLINENSLKEKGASFFKIDRGGDITYHGPGQIVGYPIIDLNSFNIGVKEYVFNIEETIIRTVKEYGIIAERILGATGVWLDTKSKKVRKMCAIGVRVSRGITMHGFAFNVNTDLNYFKYINPCGFTDKSVTSLQKELGKNIDVEEVKQKVRIQLVGVFGMNFI